MSEQECLATSSYFVCYMHNNYKCQDMINDAVKFIVPDHVWLIVGLQFHIEFRNPLIAVNCRGTMIVYSTHYTTILDSR